jgi:hypothetical protein
MSTTKLQAKADNHTFTVEAETAEETREIALDLADDLPDNEWDESFVGVEGDIESEIIP